MGINFGQYGDIELKRDALNSPLGTVLDPYDVDTNQKRFSVDGGAGSLITGDYVEIKTLDGSNLELVSGHSFPDGSWYVHVDALGGIRLYTTFEDSITGSVSNALALVTPSSSKDITLQTSNSRFRHLASIRDFELITNRDSVNLTQLGDQFKKQYEAGLISGQGTIQCFWEHSQIMADQSCSTAGEFPFYLAQLLVRLQQGADFYGRFWMLKNDANSLNDVWYEANCIVTNVAINVPATDQITTRIEFITNGEISIHTGAQPSYLLQEDQNKILQEDGSGILLPQQ